MLTVLMSLLALSNVQVQWYEMHQHVQLCMLHSLGVCPSKL